jgi:hypothetical protein
VRRYSRETGIYLSSCKALWRSPERAVTDDQLQTACSLEVGVELQRVPVERQVTTVAAVHETQGEMVGVLRAGEVGLVTRHAFHAGGHDDADFRSGMTTMT